MMAPAALLLLLFLIVPVLLAFTLSFTNARLISPNPPRFVGLDNFFRAFTADPVFLQSALNTSCSRWSSSRSRPVSVCFSRCW